jgi:hypothetical protein
VTFATWYESVIKPQLEETLKSMPVVAREPLRTASRMSMAACWNAALEAGKDAIFGNLDIDRHAVQLAFYELNKQKIS